MSDEKEKKFFIAKCGSEKIKTKWKAGHHKVKLDVCVPNDWNMNTMDKIIYEKTKQGVADTREQTEDLPPITCRPHPKYKRKLQIVDGFHRWKMAAEQGVETIDVFVIYVDTKVAMMMTAQLNYNRGEQDLEKYPEYLARLMKEHDIDAEYLAERLPDTVDEINNYMQSIDFELEDVTIPRDDEGSVEKETKDASDNDALVELRFVIRKGAGEVVQKELTRLKKALGNQGKNLDGRALEAMAVLSSQTPAGSLDIVGVETEPEDTGEKISRKKKHKNKAE